MVYFSSVSEFLDENEDTIVSDVIDRYGDKIGRIKKFSGVYRKAYEQQLRTSIRAYVVNELGNLFNLDAEQQMLLDCQLIDKIIDRSLDEQAN